MNDKESSPLNYTTAKDFPSENLCYCDRYIYTPFHRLPLHNMYIYIYICNKVDVRIYFIEAKTRIIT